MKILRRLTFSLFVVALCLFIGFFVHEKLTVDDTLPELHVPEGTLRLSISDGEDALLQGVTAYDGKDGDLTEKVLVESISQFISEKECIVTYAVVDADSHVAKGSRNICYTDYTPPKFYLKRPVIFRQGEEIDVRGLVGAWDCIDGDISDKVAILATDFKNSTLGSFHISLQANNSRGDMIYLDLPVHVEPLSSLTLDFRLKEDLIYVKKGAEVNLRDYVEDAYFEGRRLPDYRIIITSNLDRNKIGIQQIHYLAVDGEGHQGHAILTVVVEE